MSYDLMVFDPQAAPAGRESFLEWYQQQTEWEEEHGYDAPAVSTPALRDCFFDMITLYPAMNGPYAQEDVEDEDDPKISEYCVGQSVIYVSFAWSMAKDAYKTLFNMAEKHKLGFFDVSTAEGEVWMHGPDGKYKCIHNNPKAMNF
ncbi:MAG: hypothetical protein GY757_23400 [bacterium]|nr:hypothetical protein [bacterium]